MSEVPCSDIQHRLFYPLPHIAMSKYSVATCPSCLLGCEFELLDLLFAEPEIVLVPFEQLWHCHFMHFLAGRSYTTTASHRRIVRIQYLNSIVQCSLVLFACTMCDTSNLNPAIPQT